MNFRLLLFVIALLWASSTANKRPHIVFILADDLGWNDVSYHGSPEIPTPNIDALAASGIVLQKYYTSPICTPSRGALMTGIYPIYLGLQNHVIQAGQPDALPLHVKILPQFLKRLGYSTHAIGKWHLGYFKAAHTPTHRGFDTFFGFWNGKIDYYDYTSYETVRGVPGMKAIWGIDLHNGTDHILNFRGRYATDVFTEVAIDTIKKHDVKEPLFLYLSHLACHAGNSYQIQQAPPKYLSKFPYIKDIDRRTFAGTLTSLDESVGAVFKALHEKKMLDDTIIVFSSDNGGDPNGIRGERSNNWPLRSVKFHLWEGGVRVPALVWSPLLKDASPGISNGLIHISDWLPTLYRAAGGHPGDLGDINGMDMWAHLQQKAPSPRKEIMLNINSKDGTSALIAGNYKLIWGSYPDGKNSWYGTSGWDKIQVKSLDKWVWDHGSVVKDILQETSRWPLQKANEWRKDLFVECGNCIDQSLIPCDLNKEPCLYDLSKDPCEYENLATRHPSIVDSMVKRLKMYNETAIPMQSSPIDPAADPKCHNFSYVSWMEEEHISKCLDQLA